MVYDGGVLALSDVEAIVVPARELAGFQFVAPGQAAAMVTPLVARRISGVPGRSGRRNGRLAGKWPSLSG